MCLRSSQEINWSTEASTVKHTITNMKNQSSLRITLLLDFCIYMRSNKDTHGEMDDLRHGHLVDVTEIYKGTTKNDENANNCANHSSTA
jgi:hypothetical protein